MSRPIHHLLLFVLALATGAAGLLWGGRLAPVRQLEAGFSKLIVAAALGAPYLIEPGTGANQTWIARRLTSEQSASPPQFLGLGDDPQRVFERNPPSAGDFAVILSQLKRHGHNKVAVSLAMAWDEVDPIALAALEDELASFSLALCASPLARGITPQPMPPAFARASVPGTRVIGNTRLLPLVNRTANPSVMLASHATLAGFSLLESEDPPEVARRSSGKSLRIALLARWDDRVVLAFPLLVAMARAEVRPDELEIRLGEFIRLGPHGRLIPIDAFGRFDLPPAIPGAPKTPSVPAEVLIEALAEGAPSAELTPLRPPIILRDERTTVGKAEAEFAAILGDLVMALESSPRPGLPVPFSRPPLWAEALLLLPLATLSSLFLRLDRPRRLVASLVTAALTVVLLLALGQHLHLTPAGIPALGVLAAGLLTRGRRCTTRTKTTYFSTTTHFQ